MSRYARRGPRRFDVVVVGLGGAGSAAAYHLARGGHRVLGLEQFGPNHAHGSSHGRSRIYRTAYFEGPTYVPFVRRAQRLWRELEARSRLPILRETGGLVLGPPDSAPVRGALASARRFRLEHRLLAADQVERRFPQFRVPGAEVGVWERRAGVLLPENAISAHLGGAAEAGAELHFGEPVRSWSAGTRGVRLRSATGEYTADRLVLTAGPWTAALTPDLRLPLALERQVVYWFAPRPNAGPHGPDRMPVFIWGSHADRFAYGTPDLGDGVKVASEAGSPLRRPEASGPGLRPGEGSRIRQFVADRFPGLDPRPRAFAPCIYTNAPDHRFVLGPHPGHRNVLVVSACSGHGFKFASAVGEAVRSLVEGAPPAPYLAMFDPARFGRRRPS